MAENKVLMDEIKTLAYRGESEALATLLRKDAARVNMRLEENGGTALHVACGLGHTETALKLLELGADLNNKAIYGVTALHAACSGGHTNTALALLQKGANIHGKCQDPKTEKDTNGWTPLHLACKMSRIDTAIMLVQQGAEIDILNSYGKKPLDLLENEENKTAIEEAFISAHASKDKNDDDAEGAKPSDTPLAVYAPPPPVRLAESASPQTISPASLPENSPSINTSDDDVSVNGELATVTNSLGRLLQEIDQAEADSHAMDEIIAHERHDDLLVQQQSPIGEVTSFNEVSPEETFSQMAASSPDAFTDALQRLAAVHKSMMTTKDDRISELEQENKMLAESNQQLAEEIRIIKEHLGAIVKATSSGFR